MAKNPNAKVVFLCDVDDRMAVNSKKNFPQAKYYKDFRTMLDKENKGIDAVTVSTPDHTHAVAAMAAMNRLEGKVPSTGRWDVYRRQRIGELRLEAGGTIASPTLTEATVPAGAARFS